MKFTKTKLTKFIKSLANNENFNVGVIIIVMTIIPALSILAKADLQEYHYHYYDYEETVTTYENYGGESEVSPDVSSDNNECITSESTKTPDESTIEESSSTTSSDESCYGETCVTIHSEPEEEYFKDNENVQNSDNVILNNRIAGTNKSYQTENNVDVTTITTVVTETNSNVSTSETTTTTNENMETTATEVTATETNEETSSDNNDVDESLTYLKTFSRGTYYTGQYYSSNPSTVKGGSGRTLVDCSIGDGTGVKGSIASNYIQRNYGYNRNDGRTLVYIECEQYPEMNGVYYLDDSQRYNNEVVDFYYYYNSNCPFQYQGVITVDAWLVD